MSVFMVTQNIYAVTIEELSTICQEMESAVSDISLEYEWYNIPPWTVEEGEAKLGLSGFLAIKDGVERIKLSAEGLSSIRDANSKDGPFPSKLLIETSGSVVDKHKRTWEYMRVNSYDGKKMTRFQNDGWPTRKSEGNISNNKHFDLPLTLTPLGFTVLRPSLSKITGKPFSVILKEDQNNIRLDETIQNINGFNVICIELLESMRKNPYMRIYLSTNHGYTPVRYEYLQGSKSGSVEATITVDVQALERVYEKLWFPSSGTITTKASERIDAYAANKIVINQGLAEKDFKVEFPAGTIVRDEIQKKEYVVKAE